MRLSATSTTVGATHHFGQDCSLKEEMLCESISHRHHRHSKKSSFKSRQWDVLLDSTYLLTLCQRSDWADILKCCEMISRVMKSSRSSNDLAIAARDQLIATDKWGNAPLHLMCFHKPSPQVVVAILKAASHSIQRFPNEADTKDSLQIHILRNNNGATPLLNGCRSGACRDVIQILLKPQSKHLVSAGFTVFQCDHQGNSNFGGLVNHYEMLRKIPYFRSRCKSLEELTLDDLRSRATTKESRHAGEGKEFCILGTTSMNSRGIHELLPEIPVSHYQARFLTDQRKSFEDHRLFSMFWESITYLMDAAWRDRSSEGFSLCRMLGRSWKDYPIHAMAYTADVMPPVLVDLFLRLFEDRFMQCNDEMSQQIRPLHLAVARRSLCGNELVFSTQRMYCIQRLMELDPLAVDRPIAKTSRSVFHQAVASGLSWSMTNHSSTAGPVQVFFENNVDDLERRDTVTGLYPFMLAAVSQNDSSTSGDEDTETKDITQLTTIFELLQQSPSLIKT